MQSSIGAAAGCLARLESLAEFEGFVIATAHMAFLASDIVVTKWAG